ncbi:hypothetical protein [Streptomyces alfalfae]|uniref:hypothetical protein n=1 Tax=Streptomyces alfalfae TaxID=1642299 RepID=UPI002811194C|nr:hypothetical protein [Streptomyces alfalfae]
MTTPPAPALWEHLVQWQPATAAALAMHLRALPDDWPQRLFTVGRPDTALVLPPAAIGEQYPDQAPEIAPYDEIAAEDDCPACQEAEGTCRYHQGYSAGHHEWNQAERDAVSARPDITLREFVVWQADVSEALDRGQTPPEMPSAPVSPPADRITLTRDQLTALLAHHADTIAARWDAVAPGAGAWEVAAAHSLRGHAAELVAPTERPAVAELLDSMLSFEAEHRAAPSAPADRRDPAKYHCDDCNHAFVAPTDTESCICSCGTRAWREKPADRAAVLREAADIVGNDDDCGCGGCDSCVPNTLAAKLRRMADEAQQTEPTAGTANEDPARIDRLRPEFTDHSSVEAIDAQIRRARSQERRWHIRTEWLISLRQARIAQKENGERPAAAQKNGAQP